MKAYNVSNLQTVLDSDLVWRRRELSTLFTTLQTQNAAAQEAMIRACVPLLYAHREGFGKTCATRYLEFVGFRSRIFRELKPSFTYLSLTALINSISNEAPHVAIPLFDQLYAKSYDVNRNNFRKKVNTRSNLRYDVLKDLLAICGIDHKNFVGYEDFINKELCDSRNEIAHGVGGAPPFPTLRTRRDRAFSLMDHLKSEFVNAALLDQYLS